MNTNKLAEEAREKIKRMLLRDTGIMDEEMDAIIKSAIEKAELSWRSDELERAIAAERYAIRLEHALKKATTSSQYNRIIKDSRAAHASEQCDYCKATGRVEVNAPNTGGERIVKCPRCKGTGAHASECKCGTDEACDLHGIPAKQSRAAHASEQGQEKWTYVLENGKSAISVRDVATDRHLFWIESLREAKNAINAHNATLHRDSAEDTKRLRDITTGNQLPPKGGC